MANNVTYENLFSESRNNVVALITKSNVPDPISSSGEFRKWIYSRQPDTKNINFKGYPFLVVYPADIDTEIEGGSLDGKSKNVSWEVEIEIFTSDRGNNENDGKGMEYMDLISNNLITTFLNIDNRYTLSTNSMKFSKPTTTSIGVTTINNELIYNRSILMSFENRIKVSA